MTVERTIVCDNCGGIIASDETVRKVRKVAIEQCQARHIKGHDFCIGCISRGFPRGISGVVGGRANG